MLAFTAVLTKKLWMGAIVLLYAFAVAVCSVHALSEAKFCKSDCMNDTDDSNRCRLREQLFLTVTVPACTLRVCLSGFQLCKLPCTMVMNQTMHEFYNARHKVITN